MQEAVRIFWKYLKENYFGDYELIVNTPNPFSLGYAPEMDVSPLLLPDKASYYQTIIDVMRWMVKLGRVDIGVKIL